jgi:amino acid permease
MSICLLQVLAITIFMVIGTVTVLGGIQSEGFIGFKNWRLTNATIDTTDENGNVTGVTEYFTPFGHYGNPASPVSFQILLAILNAFPTAFYAYGGTEIVGVSAAECENPKVNVPKA